MKVVSLLSGGLDSTVLLAHLIGEGHEVRALSIHYGQRHRTQELSAAERVAERLGVPRHEMFAPLRSDACALTSDLAVPHGHYADESMRATVVPNRNMVMLALAGSLAIELDADAVAYAAHQGDHAIYPDCRPIFVDAMRAALAVAHYRIVRLLAPFVTMTKADIVRRGAVIGAPLDLTYSCYEGARYHCGMCGTCVERREAFTLAGVEDPTEYGCAALAD